MLPRLARRLTVLAPDLPGHGFTQAPAAERLTLPGMAADVAALLAALDVRPQLVVGHSAGAAVLLRLALDGALPDTRLIVGLNAAIIPPAPAWRALASPGVTRLFTGSGLARVVADWSTRLAATPGMLRSTGSQLGPELEALYAALVASPRHVQTALTMMAQWDILALLRELPALHRPVLLLAGTADRWVSAVGARREARVLPDVRVELLEGHGHLMHEEAGDELAERVLQAAEQAGLLARADGHGSPPGARGDGPGAGRGVDAHEAQRRAAGP
jgi:magnesium chelatase accessory protein